MSRLDSKTLVSALIRRVEQEGGFAAILQKGDSMGGIILVQLREKGRNLGLFERMTGLDGRQSLMPCGPKECDQGIETNDYISKRRRSDPDLWLIELDIVHAERFAADILCSD